MVNRKKRLSWVFTILLLTLALGVGTWIFSLSLPGRLGVDLTYAAKGRPANPVKWIYTTGNTIFSRPAIGSNQSVYV